MSSSRRAPVLVVSPDPELRQALSQDLARAGFETIPAVSGEEAERFFGVLRPQLVVAPWSELGNGNHFIPQLAASPPRSTTLAIVGDRPEQEEQVPRHVVFVAGRHLSAAQLAEKILLLLLGRQLGLATNHAVDRLVGSLEQRPFLELLRDLVESGQSAQVLVSGHGECWAKAGEVVAARVGAMSGVKAFARLSRLHEGAFQIYRVDHRAEPDLSIPWDELMTQAINDSLVGLPDPSARLALHLRDGFFDREYSSLEQKILRLAQQGGSVQEALDLPDATDGQIAEQLQRLIRSGVLNLEPPKRPLRLVTDSTSDLPSALSDRLGLLSVPLTVHFGERHFRDRVDIQPKSFYDLLTRDPHHPSTSPPEESVFEQIFTQAGDGSDVLSIHLSKKMSKTVENAQAVAKRLRAAQGDDSPANIQIVDSQQVSMGLGLLTLLAERLAEQSEDLESLARHVERIAGEIQTLFAVDTLTYLERGGRINKARAWLGTLLKVKPVLGLEAGEVVPIDRVRGGRAAYPRLVELLAQRVDPQREIFAMVAHANAPQWADRLRGLLEERFQCGAVQVVEIGPVVGTHTGPGTVGVTAYQPSAEELPLFAGLG